MIYCVWYPSGGFGHFVNAVLSAYGQNFVRPNNDIEFSQNGNSHAVKLVAPKYLHNPENYEFSFDPALNYSVLIDNGINDETTKFQTVFPEAKIIRICYTDCSWPIVARTMIDKAMGRNIDQVLKLDQTCWNNIEVWAVREKYFLYLRDHALRKSWQPQSGVVNLFVDDMLNYFSFMQRLIGAEVVLNDFFDVWQQWRQVNRTYIDPIENARSIVNQVKQGNYIDLSYMDDTWSQAVLYYFLWLEFKQEVPHNDYANFFSNTKDICKWLKL